MSDPYSRRAYRRSQRARVVAKARKVVRRWYSSYDQDWRDPLSRPSHELADAAAVRLADNLRSCSCGLCRCTDRPRTRQDVASAEYLREALAEVFSSNPLDSQED